MSVLAVNSCIMTYPPEIQQKLDALREQFVTQSRVRVDELADMLADSAGDTEGEVIGLIRRALHDLKGQAATFGYPLVSDIARVAEQYASSPDGYDEDMARELGALFNTMQNLLAENLDTGSNEQAQVASAAC